MPSNISKRSLFSLLVLFTSASHTYAIDYSINGFATIAAGQIIDSQKNNPPYLNYDCPCYIADYNQGAIYEDGKLSLQKDSKAGVQSTVTLTPELSVTGQAVARAINAKVSLEWAYLTYQFHEHLALQVGRKRLPIYFYSDYQDVGNSYILARPQQTLYGWEVSNFNGASLLYENSAMGWDISASIYGGSEEVKKSPYNDIYYTQYQDVKWNDIYGSYLTMAHDWFTARVSYIQSHNYMTGKPDDHHYLSPRLQQEIMGLALNADFTDWFILTEFNQNARKDRDGLDVKAPASSVGAGYRIGAFTPYVNYSRYADKSKDYSIYEPERFTDTSFTLRYDINPTNDIKFQLEKRHVFAFYDFVGDTTLVTLTYDMVF